MEDYPWVSIQETEAGSSPCILPLAHVVSLCSGQIQLHVGECGLVSRVSLDPSPIITSSTGHPCAVNNLSNCVWQPCYKSNCLGWF